MTDHEVREMQLIKRLEPKENGVHLTPGIVMKNRL